MRGENGEQQGYVATIKLDDSNLDSRARFKDMVLKKTEDALSAGGPEESGATTLSKQVSSVNAIKIQQVIDAVKQDFKNIPGFSDKLPPIRKSSEVGQVGQVEDIRKTDVSKSDVSDQSDNTRLSIDDGAAQVETEDFKRWFKNSKLVDANGEPLVVYHGTDAEYNAFDMDQSRSDMNIRGAFFSPWEDDAKGYGKNVRAFYLSIQNPADEATAY